MASTAIHKGTRTENIAETSCTRETINMARCRRTYGLWRQGVRKSKLWRQETWVGANMYLAYTIFAYTIFGRDRILRQARPQITPA